MKVASPIVFLLFFAVRSFARKDHGKYTCTDLKLIVMPLREKSSMKGTNTRTVALQHAARKICIGDITMAA